MLNGDGKHLKKKPPFLPYFDNVKYEGAAMQEPLCKHVACCQCCQLLSIEIS